MALSMLWRRCMTEPSFIITNIILQYPNQPEKVVKVSEATQQELVDWINQASNFKTRQFRKTLMHAFKYNAGPSTFLEIIKNYRAPEKLPLSKGG